MNCISGVFTYVNYWLALLQNDFDSVILIQKRRRQHVSRHQQQHQTSKFFLFSDFIEIEILSVKA